MKYAQASLAVALCAFALPALADQTAAGPYKIDEIIDFADQNDDGVITREEFLITRLVMFEKVDADKSGGLTPTEFETALNERVSRFAKRAFKTVDANNDGIVSEAEWKAHPTTAFDKVDANKDGILTADEREAKRYR